MKVSIFLPSLAGGGAERMALNLIHGLLEKEVNVDLVVASLSGELANNLPDQLNLVNFATEHVSRALFPLIRYLRKEKPDILFSGIDHANIVAILAALFSFTKVQRVISVHQVGTSFRRIHTGFKENLVQSLSKFIFPMAHKIVAVSLGVKADLVQNMNIPRDKVVVIGNPILSENVFSWLADTEHEKELEPRIVAIGRLSKEKDFETLIHAFYLVNQSLPSQLVIYGEGQERNALELLSGELGIQNRVKMPGFQRDIFSVLPLARVCVLSSLTEGFGNVIVEALACGVPVVSTDCPVGPREILMDGEYGKLVPVGNPTLMANAIVETLSGTVDKRKLIKRANDFTIEHITDLYLDLFINLIATGKV